MANQVSNEAIGMYWRWSTNIYTKQRLVNQDAMRWPMVDGRPAQYVFNIQRRWLFIASRNFLMFYRIFTTSRKWFSECNSLNIVAVWFVFNFMWKWLKFLVKYELFYNYYWLRQKKKKKSNAAIVLCIQCLIERYQRKIVVLFGYLFKFFDNTWVDKWAWWIWTIRKSWLIISSLLFIYQYYWSFWIKGLFT